MIISQNFIPPLYIQNHPFFAKIFIWKIPLPADFTIFIWKFLIDMPTTDNRFKAF
jgi:hypothetical protein